MTTKRLVTGAAMAWVFLVMVDAPLRAGLREPMAKESEFTFARGAMANGLFPAAAASYRELITLYPRDPRVWAGLGYALSAQGDQETARAASARAAELYRERVQLFPKEESSFVELARALAMAGRGEEATTALEEGLQQNPMSEVLLAEQRSRAARRTNAAVRAETELRTEMYFVDETLAGELAGKTPGEVKTVLEARGIVFPQGAAVFYLPKRGRLIFRQTGEGHAAVEKLLGKPAR